MQCKRQEPSKLLFLAIPEKALTYLPGLQIPVRAILWLNLHNVWILLSVNIGLLDSNTQTGFSCVCILRGQLEVDWKIFWSSASDPLLFGVKKSATVSMWQELWNKRKSDSNWDSGHVD